LRVHGGRKVAALVYYPGDGLGEWGWGEEAGAEGGVGTCSAEDVEDGVSGWEVVDFI